MNIAFAGLRHPHIFTLYREAEKDPETVITGCFEEDPEARRKSMEKGLCFSYSSYAELLSDPLVEVVAIGDYYAGRGAMVIEALKHDKHVICDKPICTDLQELSEIRELSEQKNRTVACMLELRFLPQARKALELVKAGEIGDVRNLSFTGQHCLNYGKRESWYFEPGKHGGTINDIGIHGVDLARLLTGRDLSGIFCARTWNSYAEQVPDFLDCGMFMADLSGVTLTGDVSYAAPACNVCLPTYWNFQIWGTGGMLTFNWGRSEVRVYKADEQVIPCEEREICFLPELRKEIQGLPSLLGTASILESQRQTLLLQQAAEAAVK